MFKTQPFLLSFSKILTWEMKVRKRHGNEIVVMYAYIFWEHVFEFIDGQGCEGGGV